MNKLYDNIENIPALSLALKVCKGFMSLIRGTPIGQQEHKIICIVIQIIQLNCV